MNKICPCCGQQLPFSSLKVEYFPSDELKFIAKKYQGEDDFYIWKSPDTDYCLPGKAKVGKWENRDKLFEADEGEL